MSPILFSLFVIPFRYQGGNLEVTPSDREDSIPYLQFTPAIRSRDASPIAHRAC